VNFDTACLDSLDTQILYKKVLLLAIEDLRNDERISISQESNLQAKK
jgi:hypothetical protein